MYVNQLVSSDLAPDEIDGFEGPEKRLEVLFHKRDDPKGLRNITKDEWQEMLDFAKCTIVSQLSNEYLDSFVLSESSLFVYPYKIMLKTCGTTTLLKCLDKMQELARTKAGTEIDFVVFSRKNFNFPAKQKFPHVNFETEVRLLNQNFSGSAHILGPVLSGGDHHFVYFSERVDIGDEMTPAMPGIPLMMMMNKPNSTTGTTTLEILMSELNPLVMEEHFYRNANFVDAKTTTRNTGLSSFLPDMQTDEIMFDPCGYSVNGICDRDGSYFTVHVTPESHCSFVSYETNADLTPEESKKLIEDVIEFFQPKRFSIVITSSETVHFQKTFSPYGFGCRFRTQYEYEEGFHVLMMNYSTALSRKTSRESSRAQLTNALLLS
jgi:S-adenosylmethionine decarboxylase